jgi:hypothetical protein
LAHSLCVESAGSSALQDSQIRSVLISPNGAWRQISISVEARELFFPQFGFLSTSFVFAAKCQSEITF